MKNVPLLHSTTVGAGPTVVLLHGYMASSRYWQRVIDDLSSNHKVVSLDLLGFGKSPKPYCSRYDYDAQLDSVQKTLDTIGITENFTLVGHSMGALLALRYAKDHQRRITKLILANMPVLLNRKQARDEIMGTSTLYKYALKPGLHTLIWPVFKLVTNLKLLPARVAEGAVDRRSYMFQSTGASRLRSMRNVILAASIEADLRAIEVKTVLISGLRDRAQYLINIDKLTKRVNVLVNNVVGGHHLPITSPEVFTQFI